MNTKSILKTICSKPSPCIGDRFIVVESSIDFEFKYDFLIRETDLFVIEDITKYLIKVVSMKSAIHYFIKRSDFSRIKFYEYYTKEGAVLIKRVKS